MSNATSPFSAVGLMNKLSMKKKFAVVFGLFTIPLFYIAVISFLDYERESEILKKEGDGLIYISALKPLYINMAQIRGMTNAFLNGNTGFHSDIMEKRETVNQKLTQLMNVDARFNTKFRLGDEAKQIQQAWSSINATAFERPSEEVFENYTALITDVLDLSSLVYNRSELVLDKQIDSHLLTNAVSERIPLIAETLGKARGLGAGIAASQSLDMAQALKMKAFLQTIAANRTALEHNYKEIFSYNADVEKTEKTAAETTFKMIDEFISNTNKEIIGASTIQIDSSQYFALGTDTINSVLKLNEISLKEIDTIMTSRKNGLRNELINVVGGAIFILICALYLCNGMNKSLMGSINKVAVSLRKVADGDLTVRVNLDAQDEMQLIAEDINEMVEKTGDLVSKVITSSNQVFETSQHAATISEKTRDGVGVQNTEIEQMATAMNEMTASIIEVSNSADNAAVTTRQTREQSNNGFSIVTNAVSTIQELSSEIERSYSVIQELEGDSINIGSVIEVIQSIAEQTNLLALNAAIEAARAGEQGRGFAVVADEVRTLASRTQTSTQEIQEMIERLQVNAKKAAATMERGREKSFEGTSQAEKAGEVFTSINDAVEHISQLNERIAVVAKEQSHVSEEINNSVVKVQEIASTTADGANQTVVSGGQLRNVAGELKMLVSEFKVV